MYRTRTCGELRLSDAGQTAVLAGWVQKIRKLGGMTFIDLRDRYGITQIVIETTAPESLKDKADTIGREFVIQAKGKIRERSNKNPKLTTGDIEMELSELTVLNPALTPPFTIEEESDGGEEIRAKYRYLDLRRPPLQRTLTLRHKMAQEVRKYLDARNFIEIETPFLAKTTPEGARDFVVPSRMNRGRFYALPQSPQTFKQLLMVAGFDRYFQIVRCFRDEDLRADRQPEFTQIDCEMCFVEREDVLSTFEGLMKHLFSCLLGVDFDGPLPRITYADAMNRYGTDKPDIRFDMTLKDLTSLTRHRDFAVFDQADYVGGICVKGGAGYTRKQLNELTEWVKRPQVGAGGLVYVRYAREEGGLHGKSSVDKFYTAQDLEAWAKACGAAEGDLLLILSGPRKKTQEALGALRIEMANRLGLRRNDVFAPLWVLDFPLFEWDDETERFYAMHHPFTAPKPEHARWYYSNEKEDLERVCSDAYDFVLNGVELGGGSIRIHDARIQERMFEILGMNAEEVQHKHGFIIDAFKYGAPPHGGIAFGFDRCCALFSGMETIRDCIAFPKNNMGRDVMTDAPSTIDDLQLKELGIKPV